MNQLSTFGLLLPGLCALLVGLPGAARAGGLEVGDTGAEALGRGGAFSAKADNAASINYNPAGFVKLRGHHITVGGNLVLSNHDFTRSGYFAGGNTNAAVPFPTVRSQQPLFAAPRHMMATTDFGYFDRLTVAAGMYVPSAAGGSYPREVEVGGSKWGAPQRFTQVQTEGLIFFPTLAIAFRPFDWLDIGISFQFVVTSLKTTNIVTAGSACDVAEDPACDISIEIEAKDLFAPTGSAGLLLRPGRNWELGAMVRLPSKSELEGTANVTLGPALNKLQSSLTKPMMSPLDPNIKLNNDYPWMVRAGLRYIFREGDEEVGDIELDFIYERWSAVSERTVQIEGTSLGKPIKPTVMNWNLNDTYGLRLGGAYKIRLARSLDLVIRAGAFYETATTDVSDSSLAVIGPQRLGICGGLGLRWGRFRLDTAYAHMFFPEREVNRSTVRVQDFGGDEGPVVGNGIYSASVDMFSFQLSVAFGRGAQPQRPAGRVPRLPHDPDYNMRRDGVFSKRRQPDPGVKSFDGGVKRFDGGIKRFAGGRIRRPEGANTRGPVKSYDPEAMVFEPVDVSRSVEQQRPAAPVVRKARRSRRSRYKRSRRRRRRGKTRRTSGSRSRKSKRVCVEYDNEGRCVRSRRVAGVVSI